MTMIYGPGLLQPLAFRQSRMEYVVAALRLRAARSTHDGTRHSMPYLRSCTADHHPTGTRLIYTRDVGHHTSGWFKNPDYERCLHLSTSYREPDTGGPIGRNPGLTVTWAKLFFGDDVGLAWIEPPVTETGQRLEVMHYRVFCDEHWQPIHPRGEVYSTEFTERGWKSWSELHAVGGPLVTSPLYPG